MAMKIFLLFNAGGVIFLLYVLANFWIEGQRPKSKARMYAAEFGHRDWTDVLVVTHPISRTAQAAVIPFPVRDQYTDQFPYEEIQDETSESPTGVISTR